MSEITSESLDARAFLEGGPLVPIALCPETGRVSYVGPQAEAELGVSPDRWLGEDFWTASLLPDDQTTVAVTRMRTGQSRGSHTIDYRLQRDDGRMVWTCEIVTAATDADGRPVLRGYLLNVNDKKRQEIALWKNESRLRALLRGAPDALVLTDIDGVIRNMNDQAEALFDYTLADVTGSSIDHLLPERLRHRLVEMRAAFERDPERRSLIDGHSLAIQRSDGSEVPVEISMSMVQVDQEKRQILASVRDLTARRRVEAQLRSSERRLREMADVVPAMVCFVDTDNRYRFVNDAYAKWLGWERHHLDGRKVREVVGARAFAQMEESMAAALAGTATHFRTEMIGADPAPTPVDVSVVPQNDEEGRVSGFFVVMFDVSPELEAREADRRHRAEMAHVARLATMGELTASIAHELNQPLTAIVANAQAARRFLNAVPPNVDEVDEALADIAADGRRAGDVIASVRQLLQRGEIREEPIEVLALLHEVVELLRSEAIGRGVSISTSGSDRALPSVSGDPTQIKQALINLLMNAIEASARVTAGAGPIEAVVSLEGSEIEIAVRDRGVGLPEDPEELFQPFVSRRPGGLGMGLTISRTIAEAHGGRLWAEPNSPSGATFRLRIPV